MSKRKPTTTRTPAELAKALGIEPSDAHTWAVQASLLIELKSLVTKAGLTHAQVAKKAKTSRTRITAILNANLNHVSTDLLIRIINALGYEVKISVSQEKMAA